MGKGNIAFGGLRGKIGNIVFSKWKGIETQRAYNDKPANPNTIAQQIARSAMKVLLPIYRRVPNFIASVYGYKAVKMSAYNAWLSEQNKAIYFIPDAQGIYTELKQGELQIVNKHLVNIIANSSFTGDSVVTSFEGLIPTREYALICAYQNYEDTFVEVFPANITANNDGDASVVVPVALLGGLTAKYSYICLTDVVTGYKYAVKAQVL